jgi:putative ABC transport system substrate-binding protein
MQERHANALLVLGDGLFTSKRRQIIALAASHRLPTIYHDHIFVEDGGLMSYGGDFADNYRGAADLVDKILKGAKPADLPVEEPNTFYLYINRKTAKALGLTIPPLLEVQADR